MANRMIHERVNRACEISDRQWQVTRRNVCFCLALALTLVLIAVAGLAFASCATPGKDGAGVPSGIINTYYPGASSVSAGATSIPVGLSSGNSAQISNGDLLLIIQMQDANINYSNSSNYGAGNGSGSGYTALNQTGVYEYAMATGPVSGGYVPISSGLGNSYRVRTASGTNGQSTFQVIRVPQYSIATVSGTVSALAWNGSVGGVVAMDAAGTLSVNGTITANGAGFRGGLGRQLRGPGSGANTDYITAYTGGANGSKGEGIAGTPNYMNSPTSFGGTPFAVNGGSGYPDGFGSNASYARGAPGNAGGGGTDGSPSDNSQNSGGGGGGNYSAGAQGGNSWSSNSSVGGKGGSAVSGLAFNRVIMGGGGGAGTTNDGTYDTLTYADPPGISCNDATGACSSGSPGGGIVLIRANSINGSGAVTADGASAYNTGADAAGGGGAGGSVVFNTQIGGSVNVTANGGDGGNAWRSQAAGATYPGNRHGPGGAGSGGFIAYSPSSGFAVAAQVNAGTSGKTTTANDLYGSTSSAGGISTFLSPNSSGPSMGAACSPLLSVVKSASAPSVTPGQVVTYSVLVTNSGTGVATGVVAQDQMSPYVSWGVGSFTFTNGTPSSGLTMGTPAYSSDHGTTWLYSPVSGGGGALAGYDSNVTNWRIPMTGTMNANGANFTINYQIQVK